LRSKTIQVTIEELYQVYFWGISEGQVIMEEERESEELFDAAVCAYGSRKYGIPTSPVRRRLVHSEKWFNAMRKDKADYISFIKQKLQPD
jgi:acyl-CoA reductase-like NAD-dependent aldehyde dehydrogenase